MYRITITVENRSQVEDILVTLSDAEEDGEIRFPFGVKTRRDDEPDRRWVLDNPVERFEAEGRN